MGIKISGVDHLLVDFEAVVSARHGNLLGPYDFYYCMAITSLGFRSCSSIKIAYSSSSSSSFLLSFHGGT